MLSKLKNNLPICGPMDDEQIVGIDAASMSILEYVGVIFRDPIAPADRKRVGADVPGDHVHLNRALVRDLITTISAEFTYHACNPAQSMRNWANPE